MSLWCSGLSFEETSGGGLAVFLEDFGEIINVFEAAGFRGCLDGLSLIEEMSGVVNAGGVQALFEGDSVVHVEASAQVVWRHADLLCQLSDLQGFTKAVLDNVIQALNGFLFVMGLSVAMVGTPVHINEQVAQQQIGFQWPVWLLQQEFLTDLFQRQGFSHGRQTLQEVGRQGSFAIGGTDGAD